MAPQETYEDGDSFVTPPTSPVTENRNATPSSTEVNESLNIADTELKKKNYRH